jgi:hypothetical protein
MDRFRGKQQDQQLVSISNVLFPVNFAIPQFWFMVITTVCHHISSDFLVISG